MSNGISIKRISSPIGELILGVGGQGCCLIEFADRSDLRKTGPGGGRRFNLRVTDREHRLLDRVAGELDEYFSGQLNTFSVPLDFRGTPFQKAVWQALLSIPYGETSTYGEVAGRIGKPSASRAVGGAVGSNPVSVLIPCHRVIQTGGSLGGYGGGLWRKEFLLSLEGSA